jgi:hypothetical protein
LNCELFFACGSLNKDFKSLFDVVFFLFFRFNPPCAALRVSADHVNVIVFFSDAYKAKAPATIAENNLNRNVAFQA